MKTTVEISEATLRRVRAVQRKDAVTLRELVEEGLNLAVERRGTRAPFRLKLPVVHGQGLTPKARKLGMRQVLALAASGAIDQVADDASRE
ncbi:MAG: DUF2191 domain-containing protein [Xanthomonadales bacterium]|nr:DUF2191 domain-containing protein [Xanthomonadales bacterium]